MTDNRFPAPGQDTRFPGPGQDARFPSPTQDTRFPAPGTDTRFDGSAPLDPPVNVTPPGLSASPTTLTYTPGVWTSVAQPISVVATLWVDGTEIGPATPSMPIDDAWRTELAFVRETAIGPNPGPVIADSGPVTVPAAPPDLGAQVQAILAGRGGMAFDPRDKSTLFQDAAGTTPVTADGQPIGRLVRKYGDTAEAFTQATAANRPVLLNGEIVFDGVSDTFGVFTDLGFFADVAGALWCYKITLDAVGRGNARITQATTGTNGVVERFSTIIEVSGNTANICRKQDASNPFHRPASGNVPVATPSVVSFIGDFVNDTLENRLRGVSSGKVAMTGTPVGNMPNTPSLNIQLGVALQACKLGRLVMLPFTPTPAEILTLEAWVNEAA